MMRVVNRVLLLISLVISVWFFIFYGKGSYPFYGDSMGYYMYLPTTFIHHNHKALDWLPEDKHFDYTVRAYLKKMRQEAVWTPKGYIINKYTYGIAAMEAPFFFVAHAYEKLTGKEATGYSPTYGAALKISALFYSLLGLYILYRILKVFFDERLAYAGTLVVFIGTNLFWFTLYQGGMAHAPLFFLYTLLIYTTMQLHHAPKKYLFMLAGAVAGLITVIRPTDIICLLIPLLYQVYSIDTAKEKIRFLKAQYRGVLLFTVSFILPLLPQMLYWKKFAGSFLYYSYGNETFSWKHPHIWEGLFSFSNGWFVYTPLMILAILGLVFYKRFRSLALVIFILLPVYIYIVYSWHCFNYINGFGSRPMIHLYPLLAIPLTAFLQWALSARMFLRVCSLAVVLVLTAANISYSFQEARGMLLSEESNAAYTMHMLFKVNADYGDMVLYDIQQVQPKESAIKKIRMLACEHYEDSTSGHFVKDTTGKSKYVYHMLDEEEYHPRPISITYNKETFKGVEWVKCSGRFMCTKPYAYYKHLFVLDFLKDNKSVSWNGCKIDNKIGLTEPGAKDFSLGHMVLNQWGYVYFFVKIPSGMSDGDLVRLDVWNIGKQEMYMDDVCVELYGR